jgi:hypothetical protein
MLGRNRKLSMSQLQEFGFYGTWIQLGWISFATHIDTIYLKKIDTIYICFAYFKRMLIVL